MVAAVWEQNRSVFDERIALLERVQTEPELRSEACRAAHQLAGSGGTFGFPLVSELARRCEDLLKSDAAAAQMVEWVAAMKAEVAIPDAGATSVELDPEPEPDEEVADPRAVNLPGVLVVSEDPELVERLRMEAGRRGLRLFIAPRAEASQSFALDKPDAVLLDLSLPDAVEILAELRRDHPDVAVLALAVADRFADRLRVAEHGAAGFLPASTPPAEVIDHVTLVLQRRAGAGDRVLVVSHDRAAQAELEAAGLEVVTLPSEGDVWDELTRVNPAAIILGEHDLELARVLRNDRRWSIVPVVVVGDVEPEIVFAAGADDIAPTDQLVARVRNHLARNRVHQSLADTDPLTGLRNRRTSTSALSHLIRLAERLDRPVCVVEIDVDHFKKVNDTHGHIAGDSVLRRLGELLKTSFRGEDVVARWGGEEFVVGLFGLDREGAIDRVGDLLGRFRSEAFINNDGEEFTLTFSAGVAQYPSDGADLESLYDAADQALYAAKRNGRDQVAGAGTGSMVTQQVDVAVIEDEDATSELFATVLTERGLRCWRFSNGAGAVQMLLGERPDVRARVILLDLNLPAVDGIELLTLFAREGILKSSRVIVATADCREGTIAQARDLGARDYLVKPIDLDDLTARVEEALGRRR